MKVLAWSPNGDQFFWFRKTFFPNQVASFKILGAMAAEFVATCWVESTSLILVNLKADAGSKKFCFERWISPVTAW